MAGLSGSAVAYTESDAANAVGVSSNGADTDDDDLEKAIVRISAGFETGEDLLAATVGSTGLTASYTEATGILEITGTGTKAEHQEVLRTVTYENSNGDQPSTSSRTIIWQLFDGANYSSAGTTTVNFTAVNDAPTGADAGATLAYTEGNGALVIDSTLTLADVDDTNLESATIQITSGYQSERMFLLLAINPESLGSWTVRLEHCRRLVQQPNRMRLLWNQLRIPIHLIPRTQQTVRVTWMVNDGDRFKWYHLNDYRCGG